MTGAVDGPVLDDCVAVGAAVSVRVNERPPADPFVVVGINLPWLARSAWATRRSALPRSTVWSWSPWNTISGTAAADGGACVGAARIAANADGRSCAVPYASPEWTPAAAKSSGYVAAITAAMAPPADMPAT